MASLIAISDFDETRFSSQIDVLKTLLHEFHKILQTESSMLKQPPSEALTQTLEKKAAAAQQLESALHTLEILLKPHSNGKSLMDLAKNNAFSAISDSLQVKVDDIMKLSQACHDMNTSNGIAIQILTNINEFSIDLLTGKSTAEVKLYGSSGEKQLHSKSQSTLGKA